VGEGIAVAHPAAATIMDLQNALRFIAPQVRETALKAAAQLEKLGVRYMLIGGLAVGAHGYVRATTGVNFLVGEEAFEHHRPLVTFKAGVPIEVDGIRIDYLSPVALGSQLEETLNHPLMNEDLPVVPIEVLIFMKLKAKRRRGLLDVVELIRAGAVLKPVRDYFKQHAADLLPMFEGLVEEASQLG
jgi:hypothetical protein